MYSLLNMGIFQPAMLVYQRVGTTSWGRRGGSLSRGAVVHVGLRAVQFAAGARFFGGRKKCGTFFFVCNVYGPILTNIHLYLVSFLLNVVKKLAGGFKHCLFSSLFVEDSHFDWFNHQR